MESALLRIQTAKLTTSDLISDFRHDPTFRWPTIPSRSLRKKPGLEIMGRKKMITGISNELNVILSQNLDLAPARRLVRTEFLNIQQNLDHFLFKTFPPGIRSQEMYEKNSRGLNIFFKNWLPKEGVLLKGILCFCHGYGDTCTFFFDGIAKIIAASGYGVFALDYPCFGLSDGLHGYIPSFDELVDDVIEHYANIRAQPELRGLPRLLMGQSMGGAVALKVYLKQPEEWDGMILIAPMCKIAEDVTPPEIVLQFLALMAIVLPQAKLFPSKDIGDLAFKDPQKRKVADYNVISYSDQMRLKTAMELLRTTREVESLVEKVSCPLLILHGAADKVTDPSVSKFLYGKASSKDKTLNLYEGGYHCVLEGGTDEECRQAINDIISWLDSRCSIK